MTKTILILILLVVNSSIASASNMQKLNSPKITKIQEFDAEFYRPRIEKRFTDLFFCHWLRCHDAPKKENSQKRQNHQGKHFLKPFFIELKL